MSDYRPTGIKSGPEPRLPLRLKSVPEPKTPPAPPHMRKGPEPDKPPAPSVSEGWSADIPLPLAEDKDRVLVFRVVSREEEEGRTTRVEIDCLFLAVLLSLIPLIIILLQLV